MTVKNAKGHNLCPFQVCVSSREAIYGQIKDITYTFSGKLNTYRHIRPYAAA